MNQQIHHYVFILGDYNADIQSEFVFGSELIKSNQNSLFTRTNKLIVYIRLYSSRGVVASAPDFERADEGSILTAGICFKSGKSECNNSGYKLTGLTWWP